jgi:23S rRNA pseudouridine1911/1915/1917 synthase
MTPAGDDAERSDGEERRMTPAGDDAERSDGEERRMTPAGNDAEQESDVGAPPACGGEEQRI